MLIKCFIQHEKLNCNLALMLKNDDYFLGLVNVIYMYVYQYCGPDLDVIYVIMTYCLKS